MPKRELTPFGVAIKVKLLSMNRTQEWLISQARKKTGMYIDSSNLYKVMHGQLHSERLVNVIREILDIERTEADEKAQYSG